MTHNYFCEYPEKNKDCQWLGEPVMLEVRFDGITSKFKNIYTCKKTPQDGPCFHRLTRLNNMIVHKEKDDNDRKGPENQSSQS